jgi:adenylate kinase family enzyme
MDAIILTVAPGAGKSTVGALLAESLPAAAHIQVDFFRKMVKGGYASPHHWSEEADRQYRIARSNAVFTARSLAEAGFMPIIEDIVPPHWVEEWVSELAGLDCRFVVLCPSLEAALARNLAREIWTVDEQVLRYVHDMLAGEHTRDWLRIDNSTGTAEDAVVRIREALEI